MDRINTIHENVQSIVAPKLAEEAIGEALLKKSEDVDTKGISAIALMEMKNRLAGKIKKDVPEKSESFSGDPLS